MEFPLHDSLVAYKITYQSDSVQVEGFVIQPRNKSNTPIVIFNRGGNKDYYRLDTESLTDWVVPISLNGFTIFASQYRKNDEFGGADIWDVLNLLQIAKEFKGVDSTKIGMVGWSRGGLMTFLALSMTDEIDCAIIGGAPTDLNELGIQRPEMDTLFAKLIPDYAENKEKELIKRSVINWADDLVKTELLIIHGELDKRVDVSHAQNISLKLNSINYKHELLIVEGDDHILRNNKVLKDKAIAHWLLENLKN